MELIEIEQERRCSREEAATWLRKLADSLSRHNELEFVREGMRIRLDVPDQLQPRPNGALRIIFMGLWIPEISNHAIAHVSRNVTTVGFDGGCRIAAVEFKYISTMDNVEAVTQSRQTPRQIVVKRPAGVLHGNSHSILGGILPRGDGAVVYCD